ncbi:MAG: hypothetical protein Q4C91_20400 [Eubacteriales bacterium]|nr:hypothetical protein [Eubacteriales bacterium]
MPNCMVLTSQLELNQAVYHNLIAESNRRNGHIALFLQPDYDFLFTLLASLKPTSQTLQIDHIFCINRTELTSENHKIYNINYLRTILPLFINALQYQPYYYYDDIHSHYDNLNIFPCMMLTSDHAIISTSDYKTGLLFHDEKVISMLWEMYNSYLGKCTPLLRPIDSTTVEYSMPGNKEWNNTPCYIIQPKPYLLPHITPELLEAVVSPTFQGRDDFIPYFRQFLASVSSRIFGQNMHLYHTRQGIELFARTGRILEIPEEICRPFTPTERIFMLKSMLPYCRDGLYRLLKKPLEQISDNLHLCINSFSGYLLCTNVLNQNICLVINESTLLSAFLDYAEHMDVNVLSSPEETEDYIKTIISKLEHA